MKLPTAILLLVAVSSTPAHAYLPVREDLLVQCQSRHDTQDTITVAYALVSDSGRQEVALVVAPDAWAWTYLPGAENPDYEWHDGKRRDGEAGARIQTPAPIRFDTLFASHRCESLLTALEKAGIEWKRATTVVHATERRSAVVYGNPDVNWIAWDRTSFRPVAAQWVVAGGAELPEGTEPGSWWRVLYELRYRDFRNLPDTVVITRELYAPAAQPQSGLTATGFAAAPALTPTDPLHRSVVTLKRLGTPERIPDPRKGTNRPRGRG